MARATTAQALRAVLEEFLAADPDLVLVGEAVGRGGGVAGTTRGLRERFGDDRVIDVPIADRAALAFATGLALGGKTVVVEISATGRLPAAMEALAEAASIAAGGEFAVPIVVRVPTGAEAGERVDRAIGDLLAGLPGVTVACGSDPSTAAALLRRALADRRPAVLLEPRALYGVAAEIDGTSPSTRVVREGDHVTLAAWGAGVPVAVEAAERLAAEGISAEVVDLVVLSPLDRATLGASVRKTGRLVAVHPDDPGLAERVLRVGLDEAFLFLESPPAAARQDVASVAGAARDGVFY